MKIMMKYQNIEVDVDDLGIKITLTQRRPKHKKLFGFITRYKEKKVTVWKVFKNGILNTRFPGYDLTKPWVKIEGDFKDYHSDVFNIKIKGLVKNDSLLNTINEILIKHKGIKKWNSNM